MRVLPTFLHVSACRVLSAEACAAGDKVALYGPILDQCYASAATEGALRDCAGEMSSVCMDEQDRGTPRLASGVWVEAERRLASSQHDMTAERVLELRGLGSDMR